MVMVGVRVRVMKLRLGLVSITDFDEFRPIRVQYASPLLFRIAVF